MLSATNVTVEPFNEKVLPIAMFVPVVAVPVNVSPLVPVRLLSTVIEVPVNDIDAAVVADDDVVIAPALVTVRFKPEANVPRVSALAPALKLSVPVPVPFKLDTLLDAEFRFAVVPDTPFGNATVNVPVEVILEAVVSSVMAVDDAELSAVSVILLAPDASVITLLLPPIVMLVPLDAVPVIATVPVFNVAADDDVPSSVTDVPCNVRLPTV